MSLKLLLRATVFGTVAGVALAAPGLAQGVPAEQPPASFNGVQYVDSEGCVFIRAGLGGTEEWVPRVGRDRNQICGQSPSLGGRTASASAAGTAAPEPRSDEIVVIGAGGTTRTAPRPTATTYVAPSTPAPAPRAAAPAVTTVAAPATRPAPPAPVIAGASACTGANAIYFSGANVRCGPQAVHPGPGAGGAVASVARADTGSGIGSLRVPRTVAPPPVPSGYRPVFDDGRFNPQRGVGTAAGDAQMSATWTNTVPRRLVDGATGQPVGSAGYPAQIRSTFPPTADGVTVSHRSVAPRTRAIVGAATRVTPEAPSVTPVRVSRDHRHVLAATYASRSEADGAYARLAAAGLPMRLGQIQRSSGMVYAVVAGPFGSTDMLVDGLRRVQSAGFAGATTRR